MVILVAVLVAVLGLALILRTGWVLGSGRAAHSVRSRKREMQAPRRSSEGVSSGDRLPIAGSADQSEALSTRLEWRRTGSSTTRPIDRDVKPGAWPLPTP